MGITIPRPPPMGGEVITQYGLLQEELNHTIRAHPGGVKSTEPGSTRSIVNYSIRASPGGVELHHTGSSEHALPETIVGSHKHTGLSWIQLQWRI